MDYKAISILLLLTAIPLFYAYKRAKQGKKFKFAVVSNISLFFTVIIATVILSPIFSQAAETVTAVEETAAAVNNGNGITAGLGYLAAALSTGMSCIGAGIAVASAASAAIGATSENSKMLAKSLIFVALAEGVALYGMLISLQIINALS